MTVLENGQVWPQLKNANASTLGLQSGWCHGGFHFTLDQGGQLASPSSHHFEASFEHVALMTQSYMV